MVEAGAVIVVSAEAVVASAEAAHPEAGK